MSIEVEYINTDMSEGLCLVKKDPFSKAINLDWDEVSTAISLLLAHRELRDAKERAGVKAEIKWRSVPGVKDED
tara:strand:- start:908 stop:1129 length:222 start_codon:yes stop_codon:yes gene_type:complete